MSTTPSRPPSSAETPAIDPRAFRRALGNFATGVTIMTASAGGRQVGVTANSFNSVSLDPPLILWSIVKRSGSYPVFAEATHFAVNILAANQIDLSNQFARPADDRFAGVAHRAGVGGTVLIDGTAASFECEKHQTVDGGDHWILIGRVVAFGDYGRSPLLYHQGTYSMAIPHPQVDEPCESCHTTSGLHSRLEDNFYYLMTQAVRAYQQAYQAERRSSGWSRGETRVLLVLDTGVPCDMRSLVQQAAMPAREVGPVLTLLRERGLVERLADERYQLTPAGHEQAVAVWAMAERQQELAFRPFSVQQKDDFRDMLKTLIAGFR